MADAWPIQYGDTSLCTSLSPYCSKITAWNWIRCFRRPSGVPWGSFSSGPAWRCLMMDKASYIVSSVLLKLVHKQAIHDQRACTPTSLPVLPIAQSRHVSSRPRDFIGKNELGARGWFLCELFSKSECISSMFYLNKHPCLNVITPSGIFLSFHLYYRQWGNYIGGCVHHKEPLLDPLERDPQRIHGGCL